MDLTLVIEDSDEINHEQILLKVKEILLKKSNYLQFTSFEGPTWIKSGALLKFKVSVPSLVGLNRTIDVDILVNKYLEVINSHLICTYCLLDKRFKEVALVLK